MQKTESRVSELVRWNAKKGGRYVQAMGLELEREVEGRVGKVYGIMAVDAPTRVGEALFAHVEDAFGRGVLEALRKGGAEATHEQLFETAIAHVNHAVSRMFGEHGFGIEPEYVSAALLSLREHEVVAAVWGQPSILLFHAIPGRPAKVLDLVDDSAAEPPPFRVAPVRRCFGSVLSGRIGTRDRLLLATQDLRDILGAEALESYASARDHAAATALIRERLSPTTDDVSIAALVLDLTAMRYLEDAPDTRHATTQASLANLRMMESRTREVMTASPLAAIQKKVIAAASAASANLHSLTTKKEGAVTESQQVTVDSGQLTADGYVQLADRSSRFVIHVIRRLGEITKKAALAGRDAARGAWPVIVSVIRTIRSKDERARTATLVVTRFNELSSSSRYLLYGALFLVLSFNTSVLIGSWHTKYTNVVAIGEQRYASIAQQIDSAEASIIYKDENHARDLLAAATTAIATLPEKKPAEKAKKDALTKRANETRDQLRHLVQLSGPEIFANVTTTSGTPDLQKLAVDGTVIWGATSSGAIFRISALDGTAQKAGAVPGGKTPTVFVASNTGLVAAAAAGDAMFVSPKGVAVSKKIEADPQGGTIDDAELYNARLYVLDAAHNRILRQSASDTGFAKPQFYLRDGTDVSGAVSLAIDGTVYILKKDGSIVHIAKGVQEPFAVTPADPRVTGAKRIRTTNGVDDLYVLDSAPARILRYSKKTGALSAQYVSPSLEGATDFTVDQKTHTAMVSVKNQLLRFTLPQP